MANKQRDTRKRWPELHSKAKGASRLLETDEKTREQIRIHEAADRELVARANALWFGFASILLLMLFVAVHSSQSAAGLEQLSASARFDAARRDRMLDSLRTDIAQASTISRDFLLEADPRRAGMYREELQQTRARVLKTLKDYSSEVPAGERTAFSDLSRDISGFWASLEPALSWSTAERDARAEDYLVSNLMTRQTAVAQLLVNIVALNQREVDRSEEELIRAHRNLRQQIIVFSLLALVLGLAVAWFSIRRIRRLEREAEVRYQLVEHARSQLRELSDRLVNAQEDERRKLSRELHDELGQTMSALVTDIGRLEREAPADPIYREHLAHVRQLAEANVRSVRDIALLLRPSMLDDLGLIPALNWQAREMRRRHGLKVRLVASEVEEELDDAYRTCIYRVVQEALNNCVKHAAATEVEITVRQDANGLQLTVRDDGRGFDPDAHRGMGLLGMGERVSRLGGVLKIEPATSPESPNENRGTLLSVVFPQLSHPQIPVQEREPTTV
ncbi:MAG: ATP-binding protein [Hyphomicrobium sp.]